jgi:trigger factor
MSSITYRKENSRRFKLKGVNYLVKESIIDGEKGLSFILTTKKGDEFTRIYAKETDKDSFMVKEKIDEKETEKTVDMDGLKKMLKSNKDLAFVKDYIENERGTYKGGATKKSKKSTAKKSTAKKSTAKKSTAKKSKKSKK